jgi:hypothetical protein
MKKLLFILLPLVFLFSACEHEKFDEIGGKGGNASINVYPSHHGVTASLDSMVVYIKYNAIDAPADGKYDDSATCTYTNALPSCSFTNLWNGNYYLFTRGYDYNVATRVKGGLPFTVRSQQPQNLNLPVG